MFSIILSPAKNLDESELIKNTISTSNTSNASKPIFQQKTETELLPLLQSLSIQDISELMGISEKLASLNYQRFQNWHDLKEKTAIYLFNGDVYEGLKAVDWNEHQKHQANEYLYILSGIYGVIRPFELIKPYRLEMGTNIKNIKENFNFSTMAHYWQSFLKPIFAEKVIINLASNEYSQAIHQKLSEQKNVITIIFEHQKKDGSFGVVGIHAKKARGLFASYLLNCELNNIEKNVNDIAEYVIQQNHLWQGFSNNTNYQLHAIQKNKQGWNVIYRYR